MTKYLIVNDEHELYDVMYADLFRTEDYDIAQIDRFRTMPLLMRKLCDFHFSDRVNRHLWLPGKRLWDRWYTLTDYCFDPNEQYWIVFLNGTFRNYYSAEYLRWFKDFHPNVRLALVMYDSYSNKYAARAIKLIPLFDKVFSFDEGDCQRHGLNRIYSTFSYPSFVTKDERFHRGAFFVGAAENRLSLMEKCFSTLSKVIPNCQFNVVGVPKNKQRIPNVISYNIGMPYKDALQYSYNSDLIVEIVREGQTGISLRTCEAMLFNKKLLTNNTQITRMPFYDPRYMSVFTSSADIDLDFVQRSINVHYDDDNWFTPLHIIEQLDGAQ